MTPIPEYIRCPGCGNMTAWYVSVDEIHCCLCGENYPAPKQQAEPQKEKAEEA